MVGLPAIQHSTFNIIVLMKSFFYVAHAPAKSLLVFLLLAFSASLFAQQASLTVQGVLTKADGTAVDDDVYTLTFRLWNHPDATDINNNRKHIETINNVETVGGVYTVILGVNGTPLNAGFDEVYYLGVSMNSSTVELLPRPRLTHAPYALGIKGQNNTFPSTGPVIGDAFRAKGGPAQGGLGPTANGYSFHTVGDDAGGMYSREPNNIELWAGGSERIQLNTTQNEIYGQTVNFGPFVSNDLTVNGNQQINGSSNVSFHHTVQGTQTVNGFFKVNTNQEITGFSTIGANQTINGSSFTKGFVRAASAAEGSGFTFNYAPQGGADDTDSGLFGGGDGNVQVRANGTLVAQFTQAAPYTNNCCPGSAVKFFGVQKGPDKPQVEWDPNTGNLQVDNSSRRLKRNIQSWASEEYKLILQAQPKLYNRIGYPDTLVELGYIAEEFDSIGLKRLVHYTEDGGIFGINYSKVAMFVNEVVKEHEVRLNNLYEEIEALKAENATLKAQNTALQTDNGTLQLQQAAFGNQLEMLSKRMNSLERNQGENNRK